MAPQETRDGEGREGTRVNGQSMAAWSCGVVVLHGREQVVITMIPSKIQNLKQIETVYHLQVVGDAEAGRGDTGVEDILNFGKEKSLATKL